MKTPATHRAAALSLAALLTLGILASINLMAVRPAPDSLLAAADAPAPKAAASETRRPRS